jgi:large subunit ribosomal protein L4
MEFPVKKLDGKAAGTITVSEAVFGLEPRADILQRMVRYQMLKRQAGTHRAKGRSDVQATSKKMYRQKGTGGARHGNKAAPQFRGGGKAFGPVVRSHAIDLPKKVRALALRHALSSKAKTDSIIVIDEMTGVDGKAKALRLQFADLGIGKALIIGGSEIDEAFGRAARNLTQIDVLPIQGINVYDILRCDKLVLTRAAIEALEERFK